MFMVVYLINLIDFILYNILQFGITRGRRNIPNVNEWKPIYYSAETPLKDQLILR